MSTQTSRIELLNYSISMLKRRGFLIDGGIDNAYISDNAHPKDQAFLDRILRENNIGYMDGRRLCIDHLENSAALEHLFEPTTSINMEMCWYTDYQWWRLAHFIHGAKVPVEILEPNIAYYCKALSACGLDTISSCDGNHDKNRSKLFVRFLSPAYTCWHALIWEYVLGKRYPLYWQDNYMQINLNDINRGNVYDTVFHAAEYLYKNRVVFRNLKADASVILTKKFCRHNNNKEIESALSFKTQELLKSEPYNRLLTE